MTLWNLLTIAETFGKFPSEVIELSIGEFILLESYLYLKQERQAEAQRKANVRRQHLRGSVH